MKNLLVIFCFSILTGCSWQEYFVVKNNTDKSIQLTYQIDSIPGGFAIFNAVPTLYSQTSKGNIDWNKEMNVIDNDSSIFIIKVELPPKSTIIIGRLNNDTYQSTDQYFINTRHFNFNKLEVKPNLINIEKSTFDNYFKKHKGEIQLNINE